MKNVESREPNKVRVHKVTELKLGTTMDEMMASPMSIAESEVHEPAFASTPKVKRVQVADEKAQSAPSSFKAVSFKKLLKSLTPKRMRTWMKNGVEEDKKEEEESDIPKLPGLPLPKNDNWDGNVPHESDVVVFERTVSSSRSRSSAGSACVSRGSSGIHSVYDFTQPEDEVLFHEIVCADDNALCAPASCDEAQKDRSQTSTKQECKAATKAGENAPQPVICTDISDTTAVRKASNDILEKAQGPPCVPILSFDDFLAGNFEGAHSDHERLDEEVVKLGSMEELPEEFIRFGSDEDDEEEESVKVVCVKDKGSGEGCTDELARFGSAEVARGEGIGRRTAGISWDDDIDEWHWSDDGDEESLVF